jgi:hypothetical protein
MVVMHQKCEGCDYTIGCGTRIEEFEAKDDDAARGRAKEIWLEGEYTDDYELKEMMLVSFVDSMPVDVWLDEMREHQVKEALRYIEEHERARLAALKEKYES